MSLSCSSTVMVILFALVLMFLMPYLFMVFWNYAVVNAISVANPINYWEAFCITALIGVVKTEQRMSVRKDN